jgi:hypothetical protein
MVAFREESACKRGGAGLKGFGTASVFGAERKSKIRELKFKNLNRLFGGKAAKRKPIPVFNDKSPDINRAEFKRPAHFDGR